MLDYLIIKYPDGRKKIITKKKYNTSKKVIAIALATFGIFFSGVLCGMNYEGKKHAEPRIVYTKKEPEEQKVKQPTVQEELVRKEQQTTTYSTLEKLCKKYKIEKKLEKNVKRLTEIIKYKVTIEAILTEATRYDDYFEKAAEQTGLDTELIKAYISVESGHTYFALDAKSPKGAIGIAQMMEPSAKELGLRIIKNSKGKIVYDERRDPEKIIIASANYLKKFTDVHKGDVILGLASYNGGPGYVKEKLEKRNANVFPMFFNETKEYIIKVLSRAEILDAPQKYRMKIGKKPLFSEIRRNAEKYVLKENENLYQLTKKYDTTLELIKKANPAILKTREIPAGTEVYVPIK